MTNKDKDDSLEALERVRTKKQYGLPRAAMITNHDPVPFSRARDIETIRKALTAQSEVGDVEDYIIAEAFHTTYEELAVCFNYDTREDSAVPWGKVPTKNKQLMLAVVSRLKSRGYLTTIPEGYVLVPEEPTDEMIDAVAAYREVEEQKRKEEPLYGCCACAGPLPFCRCARREVSNKYKAMIKAEKKEKDDE